MKQKDFYKLLKEAGFTKRIETISYYKKQMNLSGYNLEDIPKYLEWEKESYNRQHSKKAIKKMAEKLKGRKQSETTIRKRIEKLKGQSHPTIQGRTPWNKGKKGVQKAWNKGLKNCFSEKTKNLMSKIATERAKKGLKQSIEYDGLSFDSNWEVIFYKYCLKNGLEIERSIKCKLPSGRYTLIDFRVNNRLVEIKGPHFFNSKGEYIIPFNNPKKIQDEHSREKQQFWKDNNVEVIKDITPFL